MENNKFFHSSADDTYVRIDLAKNKAYAITPEGREFQLGPNSTVAANATMENNQVSPQKYESALKG